MENDEELHKKIVIDLDDTLSKTINGDYSNSLPIQLVIDKLKQYKKMGFYIIISSSRNMRSYNNNIGKINKNTLPNIIEFLTKYDIPYDELYIGKPWCGFDGFYVDDKAIRPSEFLMYSYKELLEKFKNEKSSIYIDGYTNKK